MKQRWGVETYSKLPSKLTKPILVEGLPGIGNVGKIVADFMIEELKATKIYEFVSHSMPNSVFVNEDNLVELPRIELYHKKLKNYDLLILTGDVQPIDEESCYEFCEYVCDMCKKAGVKEMITLGGIGLGEAPKKPKVYCTGNSKKLIEAYKKETNVETKVYGVVGPIVGVTGLLLGVSQKKDIEAVALLAETLGHPMYVGIKGARESMNVLNKRLNLKLDTKKLDKEIVALDKEMRKTEELQNSSKKSDQDSENNYIG